MSTLKNRLKFIERLLTTKEEKASTVDYVVKYVDASEAERSRMEPPVMTVALLKQILDESIERAIARMSEEEIEEKLRKMEEMEKAAGL